MNILRSQTRKILLNKMKFIDIGANLSDPMFQGVYGGSQKHEADLNYVLKRSWDVGMDKIILTVGTVNEAEESFRIADRDSRIFTTIGCHPTRCGEFKPNPDEYLQKLAKEIENNRNKVVAVGELGLDYDRLHFCDKETQKLYFQKQLNLSNKFDLPLFLHCRNSHEDFFKIVKNNLALIPKSGVIHSFDGSLEEALKLIELGFFIGINGCSLKTEENLKVVKDLPNDKIMIETDAPWCTIRNSYAGAKFVKTKFPTVKKKEKWSTESLIDGRNEPCQIIQVLEVIAGVKNEDINELADQFYTNTNSVFFTQ